MSYQVATIMMILGSSAALFWLATKLDGMLKLLEPLCVGLALWLLIGGFQITYEFLDTESLITATNFISPLYNLMLIFMRIFLAVYMFTTILVQPLIWLYKKRKSKQEPQMNLSMLDV